jgi:hypothetical protein
MDRLCWVRQVKTLISIFVLSIIYCDPTIAGRIVLAAETCLSSSPVAIFIDNETNANDFIIRQRVLIIGQRVYEKSVRRIKSIHCQSEVVHPAFDFNRRVDGFVSEFNSRRKSWLEQMHHTSPEFSDVRWCISFVDITKGHWDAIFYIRGASEVYLPYDNFWSMRRNEFLSSELNRLLSNFELPIGDSSRIRSLLFGFYPQIFSGVPKQNSGDGKYDSESGNDTFVMILEEFTNKDQNRRNRALEKRCSFLGYFDFG